MTNAAPGSRHAEPNRLLVEAIDRMHRLRFIYSGKARLAEPQCYGIGHRGTELLRVYLLQGVGQQAEPLFDVAKISDLRMLDETFSRPGPNYKENDSAMKIIFAQLTARRNRGDGEK